MADREKLPIGKRFAIIGGQVAGAAFDDMRIHDRHGDGPATELFLEVDAQRNGRGVGVAGTAGKAGAVAGAAVEGVDSGGPGTAGKSRVGADIGADGFGGVERQGFGGEPGTEIGRYAVKPATVDDGRSFVQGRGMVAGEHGVNECGLAGDVQIMGARFETGLHDRLPVPVVGTGGVDENMGPGGHGLQGYRIMDVGEDDSNGGLRCGKGIPEGGETVVVTAGDGDAS